MHIYRYIIYFKLCMYVHKHTLKHITRGPVTLLAQEIVRCPFQKQQKSRWTFRCLYQLWTTHFQTLHLCSVLKKSNSASCFTSLNTTSCSSGILISPRLLQNSLKTVIRAVKLTRSPWQWAAFPRQQGLLHQLLLSSKLGWFSGNHLL